MNLDLEGKTTLVTGASVDSMGGTTGPLTCPNGKAYHPRVVLG